MAYTRRGANNDHIARHRAPLFVAQVDLQSLQVIRSTEQILLPERGVMSAPGLRRSRRPSPGSPMQSLSRGWSILMRANDLIPKLTGRCGSAA
ncbi:MAG: hypothetical protein U0872_16530 [Planctomycetaceae bacterium]